MRFDTPIYFQSVVRGEYNATTGDYADDTAEEVERYASVSDTGTDTLTLVYGGLSKEVLLSVCSRYMTGYLTISVLAQKDTESIRPERYGISRRLSCRRCSDGKHDLY